jgi:hypothetical protein
MLFETSSYIFTSFGSKSFLVAKFNMSGSINAESYIVRVDCREAKGERSFIGVIQGIGRG